MLEGLKELESDFLKLGFNFWPFLGNYEEICLMLAKDASIVITDWGYLPFQRQIRENVALNCNKTFFAIESDVVVPVEIASNKKEPYAMTFRPKIMSKMYKFLKKVSLPKLINNKILKIEKSKLSFDKPENLFSLLKCPSIPRPVSSIKGGRSKAIIKLKEFIENKLINYDKRSNSGNDFTSCLSPYLHFGQISPIEIALSVREAENIPYELKNKFLDELIVWRELARNFITYEKKYDSLLALPLWAKKEIEIHKSDFRPIKYKLNNLKMLKHMINGGISHKKNLF